MRALVIWEKMMHSFLNCIFCTKMNVHVTCYSMKYLLVTRVFTYASLIKEPPFESVPYLWLLYFHVLILLFQIWSISPSIAPNRPDICVAKVKQCSSCNASAQAKVLHFCVSKFHNTDIRINVFVKHVLNTSDKRPKLVCVIKKRKWYIKTLLFFYVFMICFHVWFIGLCMTLIKRFHSIDAHIKRIWE